MAQSCENSSLAADDTHKDVDKGGLAGTVGAQKTVYAIGEGRRKILQGVFPFVFFGNMFKSDIHIIACLPQVTSFVLF